MYSPLQRTRETAELLIKELGLSKDILKEDVRLKEIAFGEFEGKLIDKYHSFFEFTRERLIKRPEGGETWIEVKNRIMDALTEIEKKHTNKNILIISHNGPLQMIQAGVRGYDVETCGDSIDNNRFGLKTGEVRELSFVAFPHNKDYELDLHRPYIDDIEVVGNDGEKLERIPEVIDGWVESGSMPFAEYHYPFENTDVFNPQRGLFKKLKRYPADFVSEYIAQTRTWFYYMHAVSVLQFNAASFKNVLTTGNLLAEDGTKISKSKGNYTDPLLVFDTFGADAVRYYLMSSVVMQAEDTRFVDREVKEAHNRVVNILWNTFNFYDLYKEDYDNTYIPQDSTYVLDIWILSRLNQVNIDITKSLDEYNTVHATRAMRGFIGDFSTWYVRRSRNRFKSEDVEDKKYALSVTRHVLIEFSKLIAPVMPFIAESIYCGAQENEAGEKESVHLCDWPEAGKIDTKILDDMKEVRNIVSLGLETRATAGIRVRQPLRALAIKHSALEGKSEFLELIKAEVNVKGISFDPIIKDAVMLDTVLTPELKEEGLLRELVRQIQALRKKKRLTPTDRVVLVVHTDESGQAFFEKHKVEILSSARLSSINFTDAPHEMFHIGELSLALALE